MTLLSDNLSVRWNIIIIKFIDTVGTNLICIYILFMICMSVVEIPEMQDAMLIHQLYPLRSHIL